MSVPSITGYKTVVRSIHSVWRGRNLIASSSLMALTASALVACSQSAAPAISSISVSSSPAKGDTYGPGETVEVSVRFDQAVTATGEPQVALTVGTQTRYATLFAWSSQSLLFGYTVQEADRDEDGISISSDALLLNRGTITAAEGTTDADLTHEALSAQRDSKVNGSLVAPPPRVREISFRSSPATGDTYGLGETVEVEVDFDKAVTATGHPRIALTIGAETRHATFSGWGRESLHFVSLHFSYTVQEEDRDEDGISIAANALVLNGGTITAAGTIDADLTHEALSAQHGSKVNGSLSTQPGVKRVALISFPERGDMYGLGETVKVIVEFDRAVKATGSPRVALNVGTQTRYATLYSRGRQHFTFNYTVQEEDRDEDGISIAANALALNGGTITATVGTTDVDLTHRAAVSEPRSKVNGSLVAQPRVRAIRFSSSPARGDTYARGELIEVEVEFDRTVTVSGTPGLALTVGAHTRYAAYSASWSEHAYLIYRVQEDDRDEDGISIPANVLIVIGGAITAADGTTEADLGHDALAADPGRKVNGGRVTP